MGVEQRLDGAPGVVTARLEDVVNAEGGLF